MSTSDDIVAYLSTLLTFLFGVSVLIVFRFAENGFPWHTYISLSIGYFVGFGIIVLVPIDIATVVFDRKSTFTDAEGDPTYTANREEVGTAYAVFFNTILIFGSFVLVFEEYYNTDGFFTVGTKVWSSFKRMMVDTILGIVAGIIILIILISEKVVSADSEALQLTAIIVTNTMYEFFLMFLLGYGLVSFPTQIWFDADYNYKYERVQLKAASNFADISESQLNISLEVANALKTKQEMGREKDAELNFAIETILDECPPEFRSSRAGSAAVNKSGKVDIYSLGTLRTNLKFHKSRYRMAQAKVERTKLEAYYLEDVLDAIHRNDPNNTKYDGVQRINWTVRGTQGSAWGYTWITKYKVWGKRTLAVLWLTVSLMSIVGAICSMEGVHPTNSPYFLAVHNDSASTFDIVLFVFTSLGYVAYISMWSLFQMQFAGLMDLVPGRTTPESLSFNVRMVARLAAPLVFFYLGWLAENGLKSGDWVYNDAPAGQQIKMNSAFSNFYQLQSVGIIEDTFGTMFPILLIVFALMFATNFYNSCCVYLKMEYLQFGTPVVTEEQKRAGMAQLEKSKRATVNAARRRRFRSFLTRKPEGENDEDEDTAGPAPSIFSVLWGGSSHERNSFDSDADLKSMSQPKSKKIQAPPTPPPLFGNAAIKGKRLGITKWSDRYLEVKAPGILYIYKDKASAQRDETPVEDPVELIDIDDFGLSGSAQLKLAIKHAKLSPELKFSSHEECLDWKKTLILWKDYSSEHGVDYYQSHAQALNTAHMNVDLALGSSDLDSHFGAGDGAMNFEELEAGLVATDSIPAVGEGVNGNLGDVKPKGIDGVVEMNMSGSTKAGFGKDWQERYVKVDTYNLELCIYKSKGEPVCMQIVKLINLSDVASYSKRGGDKKRFTIKTVDDKVLKFRVKTDTQGEHWVRTLTQWNEYALMNLTG